MKKRITNVNNQALYNILSTTILSGVNFFTIPIFTRMLGADNYGMYSVFHSWVVILMCIMGLETRSAGGTARYVFPEDYDGYKSSCLCLGTISSTVFLLIGILFRDFWASLLGFPSKVVVIMLLCAFGHYVVEFSRSMFIYGKRADLNFVVSVSLCVVTLGMSLALIPMFQNMGKELYTARMYGDAVPYIVAAVILWVYLFKKKPTVYNKRYWTYCLTMGLPVVFHVLANDILKQADKVMLQHLGYAGATVGIYSFLCTYTGIVQIILSALNTSWTPFYFDDLNEQAFDRLKGKCRNYLELFTVLACGFLLVSREVCYLFASEEYWSGMGVIPVLVVGIYFVFMYQFPVNFEFFHRKTRIIATGTISAAVGNIILNLLLIPRFGMYGAAFATATAYGLLFLAHYYIASHMKEMKFHLHFYNFLPGFLCVLLGVFQFYALEKLWYVRWVLGAALGVWELLRIIKRKSIF